MGQKYKPRQMNRVPRSFVARDMIINFGSDEFQDRRDKRNKREVLWKRDEELEEDYSEDQE